MSDERAKYTIRLMEAVAILNGRHPIIRSDDTDVVIGLIDESGVVFNAMQAELSALRAQLADANSKLAAVTARWSGCWASVQN